LIAHSKNKKSKKLTWIHSSIEDLNYKQYQGLKKLIYFICFKCQKKAFERANNIIAISQKTKESIELLYPQYGEKIKIIYNGIDIKSIKESISSKLINSIPADFRKNILLGVGRLDKRKNFAFLIQVISRIIHSGTECFLILVGDGDLKSELEKIAKQESVEEFLFFAGFQANPYPYFNAAKILCVSSFVEGFPTVVGEAMALGKPFVTTPVAGSSEELADNGRCGLAAGWNVDEYAGCVKKLLLDDTLYETMSRNCLEKIKEFSVERSVDNFNRIILENE
jgi:glycosyltransferase involved in cell wall biosynthesis